MISNITKPEIDQGVHIPIVYKGAITRQRAKILQHKFNESMILASDLGQVKPVEGDTKDVIKRGALKSSLKNSPPPLLPCETSTSTAIEDPCVVKPVEGDTKDVIREVP
ncbi:hypothetical protein Bca4012_058486 [Brassica carinata]